MPVRGVIKQIEFDMAARALNYRLDICTYIRDRVAVFICCFVHYLDKSVQFVINGQEDNMLRRLLYPVASSMVHGKVAVSALVTRSADIPPG